MERRIERQKDGEKDIDTEDGDKDIDRQRRRDRKSAPER